MFNSNLIYSVEWDSSNPSTKLKRLNDSKKFPAPRPATGTGQGFSPFDNIYPWSEMGEYNIIDGQVAYQKGDKNFSRKNDTVVRIPKFWYRTEQSGTKMRFYIAGQKTLGFQVHPVFNRGDGKVRDCIYVGRYPTGKGFFSKTGLKPLENEISTEFRKSSRNKGKGWYQWDYATLSAIQLLYLVEFANWDAKKTIGRSNWQSFAGTTDEMLYHTGGYMGIDGKDSIQYRGIEGLWGEMAQIVDGINIFNNIPHICLDPNGFGDFSKYVSTEVKLCDSGWISNFTRSDTCPFAFLPTESKGTSSTYIADSICTSSMLNTNSKIMSFGFYGLFGFDFFVPPSYIAGSRLMFLPKPV